jgi:ribosomal-protein-alanine N-acetyltransferase
MLIEPATLADLDAIDEIEQHSFPRPWPRSAFAAEIASGSAQLDVARGSLREQAPGAATRVVGFCNYWIVTAPPGSTGEVHILAIATHPDHRRRGTGAGLLRHALDRARAERAGLATLEVRRGNAPAIALYERFGFSAIHIRRGYYQDNDEDALVMIADLTRFTGSSR